MIRADQGRVVQVALGEVGYRESPPRSNRSKYGAWYGLNPAPWCAMFVSWVFWHAGHPLPAISTRRGFAYVPALVDWARRHGIWRPRGNYTPRAGDLVVFSFGGQRADHVGIVRALISGGVQTIEGNTSGSDPRNGGMVAVVNRRSRILGYVEVTAASPTAPAPQRAPAKPTPAPEEDESVRSRVVTHHNGEVWLHFGTGFRARLNHGPTHEINHRRKQSALKQTEGREEDLSKDPGRSQDWLDSSIDIVEVKGTSLRARWLQEKVDEILQPIKQTALRATWLQTVVGRIAKKLGVET